MSKLNKAEEPTVPQGLDLCVVLDYQVMMLKQLQKIDFSGLYDAAVEDKIKCVTGFYSVIRDAQIALRKQIKEEIKKEGE